MGLLRVRPALRYWAEPGLRLAGGGGLAGGPIDLEDASGVWMFEDDSEMEWG